MEKAEIGLIGLAVMGSNLALNIAEKGNKIAVFNRTPEKTDEFYESARRSEEADYSLQDDRRVRRCDPAAASDHHHDQGGRACRPADGAAAPASLQGRHHDRCLSNANFRDTVARFDRLKNTDLTFIGMGVSGGEEGARHGPSIMVGGTEESWKRVEKVLTSIAARYNDEPCVAWLGNDGAYPFRQDHP